MDERVEFLGKPQVSLFDFHSSIATSSAFPELLGFSISRGSEWVVAFSSSALYILRTSALPRTRGRAFRTRRKPVDVAISDTGHVMAVLWTPHRVDLYSLWRGETGIADVEASRYIAKVRTINLENEASSLSLDPSNRLLVAVHTDGIEILPVAASAPANLKRNIQCAGMSKVTFSDNSRTILATSLARKSNPSYIISVGSEFDGPISEEGDVEPVDVQHAWMTQMVFPDKYKHIRQASLLPCQADMSEINCLLGYHSQMSKFGAYDISQDVFFSFTFSATEEARTDRASKPAYEDVVPAVKEDKHIAVVAKTRRGPQIYIRRLHRWQVDSTVARETVDSSEEESICVPLWYKDAENDNIHVSHCQWLRPSGSRSWYRLVTLLSSSSAVERVQSDPVVDPVAACGQICIADFLGRIAPDEGYGGDLVPPIDPDLRTVVRLDEIMDIEEFPEEHLEFEQEVALQRSRTMAQRRQNTRREANRRRDSIPQRSRHIPETPSRMSSTNSQRVRRRSSVSDTSEFNMPMDEPYTQGQPRPVFSLHRAQTIAASSGAARSRLRGAPDRPLDYRRADGMREIPHESDADNWVPPPPPYTRDPDPPGPGAVSIAIAQPTGPVPPQIARPPQSPLSPHIPVPASLPLPPPHLPVSYSPARPTTQPQGSRFSPPRPSPPVQSFTDAAIPQRRPSRLAAPRLGSISTSMTFPGGRQPSHSVSAGANGQLRQPMYQAEANANASVMTLPIMGSNGLYYAPRAGSTSAEPGRPKKRSRKRLMGCIPM